MKKNKKVRLYRQGDVLLKTVDKIPNNLDKEDKCILAYGEVTGHKHQILKNGMLMKNKDKSYLKMIDDGILKHEEHSAINVPKGEYEVIIQREFDLLGEVRSVMD